MKSSSIHPFARPDAMPPTLALFLASIGGFSVYGVIGVVRPSTSPPMGTLPDGRSTFLILRKCLPLALCRKPQSAFNQVLLEERCEAAFARIKCVVCCRAA